MEQNYILENEYLVQKINKESNNLYGTYPTHFSMFVMVCSNESCSCCKLLLHNRYERQLSEILA